LLYRATKAVKLLSGQSLTYAPKGAIFVYQNSNSRDLKMQKYEIKIENLGFKNFEHEVALIRHNMTTDNILNALHRLDLNKLFVEKRGYAPRNLGTVIDFCEHDQYVIIGHDGSECGNIKTVQQLIIYWKKIDWY
jgi:hypothetical protein